MPRSILDIYTSRNPNIEAISYMEKYLKNNEIIASYFRLPPHNLGGIIEPGK